MFRYCPSCASQNIAFVNGKTFRCPDCGFTYYHNVAAATACFIRTKNGILFQVRGKEPGRGKLDLPGGFVDPGEGAVAGLIRELREEMGLEVSEDSLRFITSFANKYPYKNIMYNTCDLFFALDAPELEAGGLKLEKAEVEAARFIQPERVNMEEIAFESVKKALGVYLKILSP
jgi:ADP-ribose pyrophosphatase YjhB (NUDIX family)